MTVPIDPAGEMHLPLHRHSEAAYSCMSMLKSFHTERDPVEEGWTYHCERSGVKIYSKVLPGERMPHFRGEGWIDGDHCLEDVGAILKSLGARAIWDERMDFGTTVAMFNSNEVLTHIGMKGTFPVGDRDISIVSNYEVDSSRETFYYASGSVEDPLIPVDAKRVRANLTLAGWIAQKCKSRPISSVPAASSSPTTTPSTSPVNRYSPPTLWTTPPVGPSTTILPPTPPRNSVELDSSDVAVDVIQGPCIRCTYIVQIDVHGSVPQSIVHALTMQLPLCVSTVARYLSKSGFPPYLSRRSIKQGITVLSEEFEHKQGCYSLVYKVQSEAQEPVTEIRFCRQMFKDGFDVEVKRATQWRMVDDEEEGKSFGGITLRVDNRGLRGLPVQINITRKAALAKRMVTPPFMMGRRPGTTGYSGVYSGTIAALI